MNTLVEIVKVLWNAPMIENHLCNVKCSKCSGECKYKDNAVIMSLPPKRVIIYENCGNEMFVVVN